MLFIDKTGEQTGFRYHINKQDWLYTPTNEERGYIQPQTLSELWFHTGTICNLSCPFCLEGSKPGDDRLNKITFEDTKPFIDEALLLGVERFSFTGGEPFVIKDTARILDYCLNHRPCLVLTNATDPLKKRLPEILPFLEKPHPLNFRVSFDYPDPKRHDKGRGEGNFELALETLGELYHAGFGVSIARQREEGENVQEIDRAYQKHFKSVGVPTDIKIISFPDFLTPGTITTVPHITKACMTQYHTEETRSSFMCSFSKMVIKRNGQMKVTACTLVDDDADYDLGDSLKKVVDARIMLKHHRCYSCFAHGASCSEG